MDDLRERVAELAGINLTDFLEEGKGTGTGGQTQGGKGKAKVGRENFDTFKSVSGELRPTAAAHVRRTRYSLDLVNVCDLTSVESAACTTRRIKAVWVDAFANSLTFVVSSSLQQYLVAGQQ